MKRLLFILLAITMVSCSKSWYDGFEDPLEINVRAPKDSVCLKNYMDSVANVYKQMYDATYVEDSILCRIMVEGKLIVDGGSGVDITGTVVTVGKVIVRVWPDGRHGPITYYPNICEEAAEPEVVTCWQDLPEGVTYSRKKLLADMMVFSYKDSFYIEVEVLYNLRTRDEALANGYVFDRYYASAKYSSSQYKEDYLNFLVPLELTTIKFGAEVADVEEAN